jgi:solute carrier family 38 (sodium-coupled neutral amino acid transporter), member 9
MIGSESETGEKRKNSSVTVIFSVWNTMVGTGMLTIPWAYSNTGFILGISKDFKVYLNIVITLICFLISYYTCWLVLKTAGKDTDYTDTLQKQFGRKGFVGGMILFILNLCIPIILYFQLLAQNLYPIIMAVTGIKRDISTSIDFSEFSYSYTCIIVMVVLMGMTAIRKLGFFVKFNTFGVIFIFMIIAFILSVGVYGFTSTHYTFTLPDNPSQRDPFFIKLFSLDFAPLMGILGGGYYLHNITLPIIRNSANPKNNARDVFIGYFLVFISYSLCGVMGYFGFSGTYFTKDPSYAGIKSNCLFMFPSDNIVATIIRFATFC